MIHWRDGTQQTVTLDNVKVIPGLACNLFSLTAAVGKGFTIGTKDKQLTITKEDTTITFDRQIQTKEGFLIGIHMEPQREPLTNLVMGKGYKISAQDLHEKLGHIADNKMRKIAKSLGWKVTGTLKKCKNCALAKQRQKNVPKTNDNKSVTPGE